MVVNRVVIQKGEWSGVLEVMLGNGGSRVK